MDTFQQLSAAIRTQKRWQCTLLFDESNPDTVKHNPKLVNLCDNIVNKQEYVFSSRYNGMIGKTALVSDLQRAAIRSGFKIVCNNPKKEVYCAKYIEHEIYFSCQHGCTSRTSTTPKKSTPKRKKRKYTRHVKKNETNTSLYDPYESDDERCPFSFTVHLIKNVDILDGKPFFMQNKGCWVLKKKRGCTSNKTLHCGHRQLMSSYITAPAKLLPDNDVELASQCAKGGVSAPSVAHLLTVRNNDNIDWNPSQIRNLLKKKDHVSLLSPNASSADSLVSSLENRNDVNYLYLTYHPLDGLMLVKGMLNSFIHSYLNYIFS